MSSESLHPPDLGAGQASLFQIGYILNRRGDWIWFLGLPLVALATALGSQRWLPYVALASVKAEADHWSAGYLCRGLYRPAGGPDHPAAGSHALGLPAQHHAAAWIWPHL